VWTLFFQVRTKLRKAWTGHDVTMTEQVWIDVHSANLTTIMPKYTVHLYISDTANGRGRPSRINSEVTNHESGEKFMTNQVFNVDMTLTNFKSFVHLKTWFGLQVGEIVNRLYLK
jgi:hypothetical protein